MNERKLSELARRWIRPDHSKPPAEADKKYSEQMACEFLGVRPDQLHALCEQGEIGFVLDHNRSTPRRYISGAEIVWLQQAASQANQ